MIILTLTIKSELMATPKYFTYSNSYTNADNKSLVMRMEILMLTLSIYSKAKAYFYAKFGTNFNKNNFYKTLEL